MREDFDILAYLMGKQAGGGGGGGDITVESKSISANGTYTAPTGKAYSPVTVSVPNSYAAGDEGKVVSNGTLVAQGSDTATQNGTVDTTLINSLNVNVSGGSGYGYTKLAEDDVEVNTTSTTQTIVKTLSCGLSAYTTDKLLYVRIRDKAGKRNGYYFGSDSFYSNKGISTANIRGVLWYTVDSSGAVKVESSNAGIYPNYLYGNGNLDIAARYFNSPGIINGTFHVEVYLLDWPDGVSPFN